MNLCNEREIETIAKTYAVICNVYAAVKAYDQILAGSDFDERRTKNKADLSSKLIEYNELTEVYNKLPDKIREFPFLRAAKSELDEKVMAVSQRYGLVYASSV